jgi:DNA-binding transcriptional regulator GbsR (MarR family)
MALMDHAPESGNRSTIRILFFDTPRGHPADSARDADVLGHKAMTQDTGNPLITSRRQFIDLWGQMAGHWGVNRTMARIHALLMVSAEPITAEQIMEELQISRGNVSMNLRDLVNWGIVRRTTSPGERRDFFITEGDVWVMFQNIFRERKRRELDPLLNRLEECLQSAGATPQDPSQSASHEAYVRQLQELIYFFSVFHRIFGRIAEQPPGSLAKMAAMLEAML